MKMRIGLTLSLEWTRFQHCVAVREGVREHAENVEAVCLVHVRPVIPFEKRWSRDKT